MQKRLLPFLVALALASCGGGSAPPPPAGRAAGSFGPSGGSLRAPLGSRLRGVEVTIPPGALRGFVELTLASADPFPVKGGRNAGPAFRLVARPDPGFLLRDVILRSPVASSPLRSPSDLVVVLGTETRANGRTTLSVAPAKTAGGLSADGSFFEAAVRRFAVYEPVLADQRRRLGDAAALVKQGVDELEKGTKRGVQQAGVLFRQALDADPFANDARFFAALARLALLLNDRTDRTAAIESTGELVEAFGLRLGSKTLVERLLTGDLPSRIVLPPSTPRYAAVLRFLTGVVRPELAAIRAELLEVGDHLETRVDTSRLPGFGATREIDFGEVAALRAGVALLDAAIDAFEGTDLDVDVARLDRDAKVASVEDLLAKRPNLGRSRAARFQDVATRLVEVVSQVIDGFRAVDAETDDQSDDILVFGKSTGRKRRDDLLGDLLEVRRSLLDDAGGTLRIRGQPGQVVFSLRKLFATGAVDFRALLPPFRAHLPVADGPLDPTAGGLFPLLGRVEAVRRASIATSSKLAVATIALDGAVSDWPAAAEVLVPTDWAGDARGLGRIPALDLTRCFLATDGTLLYLRIDFGDDDPGFDPRYATVYRLTGCDLTRKPRQQGRFEIRVDVSLGPPQVSLLRPGQNPVPGRVAFGTRTLEAGVPFAPLAGKVRPRVLRLRAQGLDRRKGAAGSDVTRPVIVDF